MRVVEHKGRKHDDNCIIYFCLQCLRRLYFVIRNEFREGKPEKMCTTLLKLTGVFLLSLIGLITVATTLQVIQHMFIHMDNQLVQ